MFKLYYCAPIDMCPEKAFKQIEEFKKLFIPYTIFGYFVNPDTGEKMLGDKRYATAKIPERIVRPNPIEVFGAGFNDSPIIPPEASSVYKGVISAYDLRKIRECDVLLAVTDLKQFAAGTFMELEYARNLGIYTILLVLPEEVDCDHCYVELCIHHMDCSKVSCVAHK